MLNPWRTHAVNLPSGELDTVCVFGRKSCAWRHPEVARTATTRRTASFMVSTGWRGLPIDNWQSPIRESAIYNRQSSMRAYRYLHYDVFTDVPFEGNQLAVFPEPAGLSTEQMQIITREMNFSECTFIFPPESAGTNVRMRIFTPGEELPMAGHPTIGSTFALVEEGVITAGQPSFVFGLGVGPTPVSLEWKGSALDFAWMTQKNPEFRGQVTDRPAFAAALGLT